MTEAKVRHGEYAGAIWHLKYKVRMCAECRKAYNAYMRNRRATRADVREKERHETAARSRALWRLANTYPDVFQVYLEDELTKPRGS